MSECPLSKDGGQELFLDGCSIECKIAIEKGSLAAVALFEEHSEDTKECRHKSLAFVSETLQSIGGTAMRRYGVIYSCNDCYIELDEPNGYEFQCVN